MQALSVLAAMFFLVSAPSASAFWEEEARQAASDVWRHLETRDGVVTYVENNGRRVYFSGLAPLPADTGFTVIFYRKTAPPSPAETSAASVLRELGRGTVESSQGRLAWASVDSEAGMDIRADDLVRWDPESLRLGVGTFFFESTPGRRKNVSVSRIFRSLILHFLKAEGANPRSLTTSPSDSIQLAWQADFLLLGYLKRISDTELLARLSLHHPSSGELKFEREYRLTVSREFDLEEEGVEEETAPPTGASNPPETPPPGGILRFSLSTSPTGIDAGPSWPPHTPADRFLLDAISVSLADLGAFTEMASSGNEKTFLLVLPREMVEVDTEQRVDAPRLESILNQRRTMPASRFLLGDFQFTARSETELVLRASPRDADLPAILADPIFRPIDTGVADIDMGLGPYKILSASSSIIVLGRRPARPWLRNWDASPDTVVLTVDTESKVRQARFELGESDLHEMSDAEFLKYTGSTTYMNRIVHSRASDLLVLLFNLSRWPVQDLAFRKAVAQAVDRRATLEVLLNNRGSLAEGFHPSSMSKLPPRSIAAAKELLKNYRGPIRMNLVVPEEDPMFGIVAERIQADLKPLAVSVRIERLPWTEYVWRMESGQFDMALESWRMTETRKLGLARHLASSAPENYTGYKNAAFDLLRDGGDEDAAHDLLTLDLPVLPLFWLSKYAVMGTRVQSAGTPGNFSFSLDAIRLSP